VEKFWRKLEDQTERVLVEHTAEVHAVAQALLDRNDLTGKQCIEIIRAAATTSTPLDSEFLLKSLVDETMVTGKNGNGNGNGAEEKSNGQSTKPKRKTRSKAKADA
jgi:hypothetical protein